MLKPAYVVGRMIFGAFFLYSGINHFKQQKAMAGYAAAKGVPAADFAIPATGALLVAAGASLALGIRPEWGNAGVVTFLASVSPVMHDFWNIDDPERRTAEMINFSKNVALLGAALALMTGRED